MKVAILRNDFDESYLNWVKACEKKNINYSVIEIIRNNWLDKIKENEYDIYLACPPGREELFKKLYDERIYIIDKILGRFVYPSFNEISLHENKRYLSYWLKSNKISHPKTHVFYDIEEAKQFAKMANLPVVGKMNIGASGKGVKVIRDRTELKKYIEVAFSRGLRQDWGPNLKMGGLKKRITNILKSPKRIIRKIVIYKKNYKALQKGFVILQEYVEHDYEWRVVKIGESYFGHQKVKQGDKASGTKGINYVSPSDELLNFVREICEKNKFNTMAIDLFENPHGHYLVNEMQCIFGHVQQYICEKEGKPGRFIYKNNWVFEEGMFNTNLSYDLRLENAISLVK